MKVTVSKKGQVTIPAKLRRKYGIVQGMRIGFLEMGLGAIKIIPINGDKVASRREDSAKEVGNSFKE